MFYKSVVIASVLAATAAQASQLTVYSAGPNNLITHLAQDFQALTGVRVDVFQGTTGQVMARLEAEHSNPIADVVISASWQSAVDLKARGDLLAYSPAGSETVPGAWQDSHYVAQGASALALVWNRNSQVPAPSDWADLTDAQYRNEVTMPDPAQSGTAFELLTGLIAAQGEDATWQLMSALKDNQMIVPGPNARALNPVLQGAKSVVFGAVDYIALGQQEQGEAIDVIFPSSGTVAAPRPMMILASSTQPEQAKAFLDFVLSEQGQARVAEVYLMPARSDIPGRRPGVNDLTLIDVSADIVAQRDAILATFAERMAN